MVNKLISIIMPTYNRKELLQECVDSLLRQTYSDIEIIIVDDGSTDGTQGVINSYRKLYPDKIILLEQSREGPAVARNKGSHIAKGDIILFIDDDCIADKLWAEGIIKTFENPNVGIVGGKTVFESDFYNRMFHNKKTNEPSVYDKNTNEPIPDFIASNNAALLKKVFLDINGYDEKISYPGFEDVDLCLRAKKQGYKLKYNEEAMVVHREILGFRGALKRSYYYGYAYATFLDIHPECLTLCFYYYLIIPLLVLRFANGHIKSYIKRFRQVKLTEVLKTYLLSCVYKITFLYGSLLYIFKNKKYRLLFYRMKKDNEDKTI